MNKLIVLLLILLLSSCSKEVKSSNLKLSEGSQLMFDGNVATINIDCDKIVNLTSEIDDEVLKFQILDQVRKIKTANEFIKLEVEKYK